MIVDCHTHADTEEQQGALLAKLATDTVDAALVLAGPGYGERQVLNQRLAHFVRSHRDRLVGFASINPTEDSVAKQDIRALTLDQGLKGVVLYCAHHGFNPTHSGAMGLYSVAQDLGLPVYFHNAGPDMTGDGILSFARPYLLDEVARAFPDLTLIIGCMGVPFVEQTIAVLARHQKVYADLTICPSKVWRTYNIVMSAHEHEVMGKLLFGSGFPDGEAGACMETLLGFNMMLADTNLPTVPRGSIRNIIERDAFDLMGIDHHDIVPKDQRTVGETADPSST